MKPLAVTAFYDVGRGNWKSLPRSRETYIRFYRNYLALLPVQRYLLADADTHHLVEGTVDYVDKAPFDQIYAHRFLEPTILVMQSKEFRSRFTASDDLHHIEHIHAEYNVAVMAKWDALERAAALTNDQFSHYVWIDFGLGHRSGEKGAGYLPTPVNFSPIARSRIVVSAQSENALSCIGKRELAERVAKFTEQASTGVMIVPAELLRDFCDLARECYQALLDMELTTDDQLVVDMCIAKRPEMFHLSYPPVGLTKFNHIHNIINGLDRTQTRTWRIPLYDKIVRKSVRSRALRRIGLIE